MERFNRILITGAAGALGTQLRQGLAHLADHVRINDRETMENVQPHEEAIVCDLGDFDAVLEMTKDVDAIVHFGGTPVEKPFEEILNSSIRGSYHIYEGARRHGVPRIVYASSVHAIGFHTLESHIDADSPTRPDTLYGVSKVYVEALSRLYWDKWGIETLCLRIFTSRDEPHDRRSLWSWLSYRDCCGYVEAALTAPRVGHTIAFGISDNRVKPVDDSKAGHIGFVPQDSTEGFRVQVETATPEPDPHSMVTKFYGGVFCEYPNPDEGTP
ncbi:MAG: NAD(P)-dependent oxidoreductase [Pseudomonadota bacterium]